MDNQAVPPETKETKSNKEWSDKLTKYAAWGTGIYFLILAGLLFGRYDQLWTKDINELGDFLAGAFGPVAFLWLVIGYLMQHSELRLNRVSIERQAEELGLSRVSLERQVNELEYTRLAYENQIAEFKRNVDISNESLKETVAYRKKIEEEEGYRRKPFFSIDKVDFNKDSFLIEFEIVNYKEEVFQLRFLSIKGELLRGVIPTIGKNDKPKKITLAQKNDLDLKASNETFDVMEFFIEYTDVLYVQHKHLCSIRACLYKGEILYYGVVYGIGRLD
ncbi:MAG: hypothetical protein HWE24_15285 [Oceanospirillaceae bacterium]|nr:hypothetical protein [Oceanospirillaceae bacterium]